MLGSCGALVGQHQVADSQPRAATVIQQFRGVREGVGLRWSLLTLGLRFTVLGDESAADREVRARAQLNLRRVKGPHTHRVRVAGQALTAAKLNIAVLAEGNRVPPQQLKTLGLADGGESSVDCVRVDFVRTGPFEAENDGFGSAVSAPGRTERTVEIGVDAGRGGEESVVGYGFREPPSGAHWSYRV